MTAYLPKLLITGAEGQMGLALQNHALANSFELMRCSRAMLDITQASSIETVLQTFKPDAVINAAAYTAVDKAETDITNCMQVNHRGVRHLAQACASAGVPLIHLSTDYVFDGDAASPYHEDEPTSPVNCYGVSKHLGELAIREICEKHVILRVSGIFSNYRTNFMNTMRRLARENKQLRIVANQHICPTYAGDIANAIFTIATQLKHWGTYHYCSSPATNWHAFATEIIKQAGQLEKQLVEEIIAIDATEYPTAATRPTYSALNCDKIKRDYGITQPCWKNGITQALAT